MMPIRFVEIRKHWITILHNKVGVKHGRIVKIFPNHRGGFIQANKQYYFQYKNFFGKSDLSKVGDNVDFIIVESFDKKKQQNTEEAVAIISYKKIITTSPQLPIIWYNRNIGANYEHY